MNLVEAAISDMEQEAREIDRQNHKNWGKWGQDGRPEYQSAQVTREINGRQVRVLIVAAAGNRTSIPYAKWKLDGKRSKLAEVLAI